MKLGIICLANGPYSIFIDNLIKGIFPTNIDEDGCHSYYAKGLMPDGTPGVKRQARFKLFKNKKT